MRRGVVVFIFVFVVISVYSQTPYLTYVSDIKPIIDRHCIKCHNYEEAAPMPLTSYEEVASYGRLIQYSTFTRQMPPWKADPEFSHFGNENYLTHDEIQAISDWVNGGMTEGALPYGLAISKAAAVTILPRIPDTILSMSQPFVVSGDTFDQYRVFVLPVRFQEDKWIEGIEFIPGNKKMVRFAAISIAPGGSFDSLDKTDEAYGYSVFSGLNKASSYPYWYTWMPTQPGTFYQPAEAKFFPKKSDIQLYMHYNVSGEAEEDSSQIRLWYKKEPPQKMIQTAPLLNPYRLSNGTFYIPANTAKVLHASYTVPEDMELISITPQAGLICQSWELYVKTPGADTSLKLLKIKDWDFNWRQTYRCLTSIPLSEGAVIHALARYDNTTKNTDHPVEQPRDVIWGTQRNDDLFIVHIEYAKPLTSGKMSVRLPALISGSELPVEIEAREKGDYRFEITSPGTQTDPFILPWPVKEGKQIIPLRVGHMSNGSYILSIYDRSGELMAREIFTKMWEKGL